MQAVAELIRGWYARPGHDLGSVLHVQLDDFNLDDEWLRPLWYEDLLPETQRVEIIEEHRRTPEREAAAAAICDGLRGLTLPQRHVAVYLAHWNELP